MVAAGHPVGHRRRRPGRDRGHRRPPRPRAGRACGCTGRQGRARTPATLAGHRRRRAWRPPTTSTRCSPSAPTAIVYAPLLPDDALVARMLASGADVVTPLGWVHPWRTDVAALEAACAAGGSTLHGTGIHPGGITERFPLMVSALSQRITHVRAEEFSDIRTYGAPDVIRHIMLFGATPEEAADEPDGRVHGRRLPAVDRHARHRARLPRSTTAIGTRHEVAVATAPIDSPIGADRAGPGRGAAVHLGGDRRRRAGRSPCARTGSWASSDLDPGWTFGPEGERFEVEVTGDPTEPRRPSTAGTRCRSRPAWPATPASSPPPTTA